MSRTLNLDAVQVVRLASDALAKFHKIYNAAHDSDVLPALRLLSASNPELVQWLTRMLNEAARETGR